MEQAKKVCIKYTESGAIFRVSKQLAKLEVEAGKATYTTKSAMYHFWNRQSKLEANSKILSANNFGKEQTDNFLVDEGTKTYAFLKRGSKVHYEPHTEEVSKDVPKLKWWQKLLEKVTLGFYKPTVITLPAGDGKFIKQITTPVYQKYLVAVK
jgi:uncharacterized protein YxeA